MIEIFVEEVMEQPVQTIDRDATLVDAAERLYDHEIGSVIVTGDDGAEPVGIVTKSDVNALVARGEEPGDVIVAEAMSSPIVAVGPTDPIRSAANRMCEHSVKKLPVLDGGALVGVIGAVDLACYLPTFREKIHSRTPEG